VFPGFRVGIFIRFMAFLCSRSDIPRCFWRFNLSSETFLTVAIEIFEVPGISDRFRILGSEFLAVSGRFYVVVVAFTGVLGVSNYLLEHS